MTLNIMNPNNNDEKRRQYAHKAISSPSFYCSARREHVEGNPRYLGYHNLSTVCTMVVMLMNDVLKDNASVCVRSNPLNQGMITLTANARTCTLSCIINNNNQSTDRLAEPH
jgi:hypothetical protein